MSWYRQASVARLSAILLAVSLAGIGAGASAPDLGPRTYANTPVGLNFLIAGYAYGTGSIVTNPAIPLQNTSVQTHRTFLAYARAFDVWGRSGKFDIVLPYAWVSGSAEFAGQPREREVSGLGDPRLRFSLNVNGAPYSLWSGIWAAVDGTYYTGGRTTIDGVEGNDLQQNWRVSLTVALPVNRHCAATLGQWTEYRTFLGSCGSGSPSRSIPVGVGLDQTPTCLVYLALCSAWLYTACRSSCH